MSVEVCPPITRMVSQRAIRHTIGQQAEETAMQDVNLDLGRLRQANVLPFLVSWRFCLGNLGLDDRVAPSGAIPSTFLPLV